MKSLQSKATRIYSHMMHDSMRRNSSLLILSQAVLAGGLFLFYIICAHLFPTSTVGYATSFISFGLLVATFTNLGLPNTNIRFLPTSKRKGGLFVAALLLIIISSIIGGLIALSILAHWDTSLSFITSSVFLSITLVALISGTAVSALLDSTLMAYRRGEFVLAKAVIITLPRIVLPFFVVAAGTKGITGVYVVTLLLGLLFNVYIIFRKLLKTESLKPHIGEVAAHKAYASSNYFGGMFGVLPSTLVPIIILSRLGPTDAAYFYMPAQIAAFLSVVCNSVSQALMSEASQTDDINQHRQAFKKAFRHQYQILGLLVVILIVFGWLILRLFGAAYAANGYVPLVILSLSSLVVGVNWLGDTWLNINKRSRDYFLMNAFNSLAVIILVYVFAEHGLVPATIGWLLGQLLSAGVYILIFARGQLLSFASSFRIS